MRRYLFPLILGVLGCAALVALGLWQLQRMEWKQAMLAQIQSRIEGPAVPLPETPDPSMKYMPVTVSGMTTGQEIDVLSGMKDLGVSTPTAAVAAPGTASVTDTGGFGAVFSATSVKTPSCPRDPAISLTRS